MIRPMQFCLFAMVWSSTWTLSLAVQPPAGGPFDHSPYARALEVHVDDHGMVDYRALKASPQDLNAYIQALAGQPRSDYQQWSDQAKIAFWLNAYNGLTLKTIVNHYPIKSSFFRSRIYPKNSIRQIAGVWDKITFKVMGKDVTLDHIEHQILRAQFKEPRIHMALVCAAMSCPRLRNEPYDGTRLTEQLDDQTHHFLCCRSRLKITRVDKLIQLSPIFKWFARDFLSPYAPTQSIGKHSRENQAVLNFVATYMKDPFQEFILAGDYKLKYLDYDWSLNEQK